MFDKFFQFLFDVWNDLKPIIFVLEYKEGVLFRAGKYIKILKRGWHLRIPFIDEYHLENVKVDTLQIKEVTVTTLDEKTVTIGCEFELQITDIYLAVIETNDWRSNLHDISYGILSDSLEDIYWADIRKKTTKNTISKKIEKRAIEMGITTSNFNFTDKSISRAYRLYNNLNVG